MAEKKQATVPATHVLPDEFFSLAERFAEQHAAKRVYEPNNPGDKPFMLVPSGTTLKDIEEFMGAPVRVKQSHDFLDLAGFIEYVNRFKTDESVSFIDVVNPKVACIIDYHSKENEPSWCTHRALYAFPHTKEWQDWTTSNKVKMDQNLMGLFIEDHMEQITHPSASELLATVIRMKEVRQVTFGQATTMQNGMVEFNYIEEGAGGGKGKFALPELIWLGMAPFRDGDAYKIEARMRYRCDKDVGLLLWYELVRPDLVIEAAVKDVRAKIIEQTELPLFAANLPK